MVGCTFQGKERCETVSLAMQFVKEDFESSEDRKGKACYLRHLFWYLHRGKKLIITVSE